MVTGASLLLLYGAALFLASLLGSGLPRLLRMTHNRTQMVLSLISGLMLGVALLHLIPHAFVAAGAIDTVMIWTLFGLIFMLLLLRWFHFHHHDFASAAAGCDLTSPDEHYHARPTMPTCPSRQWAPSGCSQDCVSIRLSMALPSGRCLSVGARCDVGWCGRISCNTAAQAAGCHVD